MTAIWETCLYQGGTLNVLLAMADSASRPDGTGIFPGLDYLSAKCRQSVRATQDSIKRLRSDLVVIQLGPKGEDLKPDQNAIGGRGHRTEYRISLKRVQELQALHRIEDPDCVYCLAGDKADPERVQKPATKDEVSAPKGAVIDVKGEVSRSHIEEPLEPEVEPLREPIAPAASENFELVGSPPPKPKSTKADKSLSDIAYPGWWPHEKYAAFAEMRRGLRAALTRDAIVLHIKRLTEFRALGHDAAEIIDQSIMNSYKGLFPVKHDNIGGRNVGQSQKPAVKSFAAGLSRSIQGTDAGSSLFDGGGQIIDVTSAGDPKRDHDVAA